MNDSTKAPKWFMVVAILALIWNIMGVMAYLGQAMAGPDMLAQMPEEQRLMIENRPAWATGAFAIAVWGGLIGCILLLIKKASSYMIFIVSLIGVIIQMTYNLFIAESTMDYGPGAIVMTLMIPLISIYLIYIAKRGKTEGWLN